MRPVRGKTPSRTPAQSRFAARFGLDPADSEEVSVFCRVRPPDANASASDADTSSGSSESSSSSRCVTVPDSETVQLVPPTSSRYFYSSNGRATNYSFKAVFDEGSNQAEVFNTAGLPLVRDLLNGKNGLLLTYGVTGSGKTHTMQGTPDDGGVMTRAIDVLFNSIEEIQVGRKFLLMPDRANGFLVQGAADAAAKQQEEMLADLKQSRAYGTRNGGGGGGNNSSNPNLSKRQTDGTRVTDGVERDKRYAVFISYVEIYNKYVYDLLDESRDPRTGKPKFASKNIIEDNFGSMYVHDSREVEVRSAKEALETFYRGQKRRRVAETMLNHQSSRSHSVFNIRLVRCCPDSDGVEVDETKQVVVSQLALVDLAGSERTSRTGNVGDRLREAGNINNSLMNLRICLEKLRENQKTGKAGAVPYRNDKMTHLFRNYFEGIGAVKMIVCVNPRNADYDETQNVLQFAEMAQEIEIERVDPVQRDLALTTPARARANQAYQDALARQATTVDQSKLNPVYAPIYSLGPAWPSMDDSAFDDDDALPNLERYLEQRNATRNTLVDDDKEKCDQFRQRLVEVETELILLREENQRYKAGWDGEKRRVRDLENRLVNAESANGSLQRRVDAFSEQKVVLENELDEKELQLHETKKTAKKTVRHLKTQLSQEQQRKRSHEVRDQGVDEVDDDEGNGHPYQTRRKSSAADLMGVGSRIAAMEAKITAKKFRH